MNGTARSNQSPVNHDGWQTYPTQETQDHLSIQAVKGQSVLSHMDRPETARHKPLSERTVAVLKTLDTYLLGQRAGGALENAKAAEKLNQTAVDLQKKQKKYQSAFLSYSHQTPPSGKANVQMSQKQAHKIQQAAQNLHKAEQQLADLQSELELDMETSRGNQSALKDFYNPPPLKWRQKENPEIRQARQNAALLLQDQLKNRLSRATAMERGGESARLQQQLTEVEASLAALAQPVSAKKQHQPAPRSDQSREAVKALATAHQKFHAKLVVMQDARIARDDMIRAYPSQPDQKSRKRTETAYRNAEESLSKAANNIHRAEDNLKKALKNDRKRAEPSLLQKLTQWFTSKKAPQPQTAAATDPGSARAKTAPQAKTRTQRAAAATAAKPTQKQEADPVLERMKAARAAAQRQVENLFPETKRVIADSSTPESATRIRRFINKSAALHSHQKDQLHNLLDKRIKELTDNPAFAAACNEQFIAFHFKENPEKGYEVKSLANLARSRSQLPGKDA